MSCQICSSNDLVKILDLGMHPPPLKFLNNNEPEQLFPLQLFFCKSCHLWQLGDAVDPSVLFKTYTYESGVSNSFKNHLYNFAKLLVDRFHLTSNDLVIDIASNDGTLLEGFSSFNIRILGCWSSRPRWTCSSFDGRAWRSTRARSSRRTTRTGLGPTRRRSPRCCTPSGFPT